MTGRIACKHMHNWKLNLDGETCFINEDSWFCLKSKTNKVKIKIK